MALLGLSSAWCGDHSDYVPNSQNPTQMLEVNTVKRRNERGRKGANMNAGFNSPREHVPPPKQELPSAKKQLLYKGSEL